MFEVMCMRPSLRGGQAKHLLRAKDKNAGLEGLDLCLGCVQAGGRGAKLVQALKLLQPNLTNVTIPSAGIPVEILAILDPLSKTAQRVAPVLGFLQKTLGVGLKVGCCAITILPVCKSGSFLVSALIDPQQDTPVQKVQQKTLGVGLEGWDAVDPSSTNKGLLQLCGLHARFSILQTPGTAVSARKENWAGQIFGLSQVAHLGWLKTLICSYRCS